jgi:hypothetical protein
MTFEDRLIELDEACHALLDEIERRLVELDRDITEAAQSPQAVQTRNDAALAAL